MAGGDGTLATGVQVVDPGLHGKYCEGIEGSRDGAEFPGLSSLVGQKHGGESFVRLWLLVSCS